MIHKVCQSQLNTCWSSPAVAPEGEVRWLGSDSKVIHFHSWNCWSNSMGPCHTGTKGSRHTVPQVLLFNLTQNVLRLIGEHASCFCYLRCDKNLNVLEV